VVGVLNAAIELCEQYLTARREMAVGNTFGATALSSYGGFWIGTAIILTPGGFEIIASLEKTSTVTLYDSFGFYLMVGLHQIAQQN
jgi:hypothetical protein